MTAKVSTNKMKLLISIGLLSTQILCQETLLLMLEVVRHGARSPEQMSYYNKTSNNFNDTSGLLEGGFDQHFNIGKQLRQRLVTDLAFLSADYTASQVYIQTTIASRTQASAIAQLSGLFPDNAPPNAWLKTAPGTKTQGYTITQVAQADNLSTRLNDVNCKKYQSAFADVTASNAYKEARGYWYQTYKETLSNLVNRPNMTETQFDATCEYLFFSQYTNIQLNFTPSAFDRAYCSAYEDGWIYKTAYGADTLWKHQSYEFLNQLNEFAQYLAGNKTVSQLTTFQKYFKKTTAPMPKFIGYFTHDEIISGYLEGLGFHTAQGAYPAAGLFFEFYKDGSKNNQTFVRSYFRQTPDQMRPIYLAGQTTNELSLQDFAAVIQKRIAATGITDIVASCNGAYTSSGVYYDPQMSIDQLKEIYLSFANLLKASSVVASMLLSGFIALI
eukprot:403355385